MNIELDGIKAKVKFIDGEAFVTSLKFSVAGVILKESDLAYSKAVTKLYKKIEDKAAKKVFRGRA